MNNFGRKTQTIKLFQCSVLNDISRIIKVKGFIPEVQVLFFLNNVNYFVIKYINLLDIQTGELNFFESKRHQLVALSVHMLCFVVSIDFRKILSCIFLYNKK